VLTFHRFCLMGKSEQEISARADEPRRRLEKGDRVRLIYHNEPTVLERSFPSSRGTVPHHGYEVHMILQNERTAKVQNHPFPEDDGSSGHCDCIFARCNP